MPAASKRRVAVLAVPLPRVSRLVVGAKVVVGDDANRAGEQAEQLPVKVFAARSSNTPVPVNERIEAGRSGGRGRFR